jgi:hypothetical protein
MHRQREKGGGPGSGARIEDHATLIRSCGGSVGQSIGRQPNVRAYLLAAARTWSGELCRMEKPRSTSVTITLRRRKWIVI